MTEKYITLKKRIYRASRGLAAGLMAMYATSCATTPHSHYIEKQNVNFVPIAKVSYAGTDLGICVSVAFDNLADFTAVVNPCRYQKPIARGGALSWLSKKNWEKYTVETAENLFGWIGAGFGGYKIYDNNRSNGSKTQSKTTTTTTTSGSGNSGTKTTTPTITTTTQPTYPDESDGNGGTTGNRFY